MLEKGKRRWYEEDGPTMMKYSLLYVHMYVCACIVPEFIKQEVLRGWLVLTSKTKADRNMIA